MPNLIKVKIKKDTGVGLAGITTTTIPADTIGFVVDAIPRVKDDQLVADFVVFFPTREEICALTPDELEVINAPMKDDDQKAVLVQLIADFVGTTLTMKDSGIDLSFLWKGSKKASTK